MLASAAAKWLPRDFVEASQTGGICTILAYAVMLLVFLCELGSFWSPSYSTLLYLENHDNEALQINFDVDLYDIECRNLKVVVFAQASQEKISTWSQDFWLRDVDSKGRTVGSPIRPQEVAAFDEDGVAAHERMMKKLQKDDGKQELDADWSSSHDGFKHKSFDHVIQAHDFVGINFFAGWCVHCQQFAPRWDQIAKKVNGDGDTPPQEFQDRDGIARGVRLIKMNCVDFKEICREKGIDAYPMIRLYKADGSFSLFEGKRDEAEIIRWIERTVKMKSYGWASHHEAFERGCNAKGRLLVPRVPGHLELTVGGGDQNLNSRMTNVSHLVKHLSFSDPDDGRFHQRSWAGLPQEVLSHLSPIDGKAFVTHKFHEAWVHDLKVVSTLSTRGSTAYQFNHQKRLSTLPADDVPQAQFHYDIEPFSIRVTQDQKKWYDFSVSLLSILGGCFVIMRLASYASLTALTQLKYLVPGAGGGARGGSHNIGHFN